MIVKAAVETPGGKWPSVLGSVVIMEAKFIPLLIFKDWLPYPFANNPDLIRALLALVPGYKTSPMNKTKTVDQLLLEFPIEVFTFLSSSSLSTLSPSLPSSIISSPSPSPSSPPSNLYNSFLNLYIYISGLCVDGYCAKERSYCHISEA